MPDDRLQGWLATIGVALIAGVWRFWHISRPRGIIFDETYYTVDARDLLQNGVEHNRGYLFTVHPPLGKWMIAFSEWIFGFQDANGARHGSPELGWRAASAVAGTVAVLLLARAARRMFRSTLLGCLAGLLLALDGLEFVLSRTGILDIFLMAWIVAALACLVVDRDDGRRRLADRLDVGRTLSAAPTLAAAPGPGCCSGRGGWPPVPVSARRARPSGVAFTTSARSWSSPTSGTSARAAPRASAGPGWPPCAATAQPWAWDSSSRRSSSTPRHGRDGS